MRLLCSAEARHMWCLDGVVQHPALLPQRFVHVCMLGGALDRIQPATQLMDVLVSPSAV